MAIVVPIQYNRFSEYSPDAAADDDDPSSRRNDLLISREEYNNYDEVTDDHQQHRCDDEEIVVDTHETSTSDNNLDNDNNTTIEEMILCTPCTASLSSPSNNDPDSIFDEDPFVPNNSQPSNEILFTEVNDDGMMDVDDQNDDSNDDVMNSLLPSSSRLETADAATVLDGSSSSRFGGLSNMGNTCYMNAALQMLASLDVFTTDIQSVSVPVEGSDKLRRALKDVLERLERGETVRPDDFKRTIDERTSLFLGYRQQDSHEFLTTLLDLIDEDYKRKEPDEDENEMKDVSADNDDVEATRMESVKEGVDEVMDDTDQTLSNNSSTEEHIVKEDEEEAATLKKQKLDVAPHEDEEGGSDDSSRILGRVTSLVELQFGDIEQLLHGDKIVTNATSDETPKVGKDRAMADEPKCKLVGGRMNPVGVEYTRYQHPPADYEAATNVGGGGSSSNQETSSKLQEGDHESSVPSPAVVVKSPVESNFTTEVRVCLTCESCKYRRSHTETFLHLSLDIGSGCSSIEDGLRKFFAPEKREIKCEKCFHTSALQTSEITKLPRALLFHLKRFIVDVSPDYTSISYRKDQSPVSFEETIQLSQGDVITECLAPEVVIPDGINYGIRGVVNHIGTSASCGHYTADAKRQYGDTATAKGTTEGREWTRFNDSFVTKIPSSNAVENSSRTAYMVMYEIEES